MTQTLAAVSSWSIYNAAPRSENTVFARNSAPRRTRGYFVAFFGETQMPNSNRIMTTLHRKSTYCGRTFRAVTLIGCTLAVAALALRPAALTAADESDTDKAQPTAFVMLAGSDELMVGAHYLLNLTNATEQKQWPVLKSYFEVFLVGVDPELPTRVGVFFGEKSDRYVWSVPVGKFSKFRKDNVASIITPRIKVVGANLFKLGNGRAGGVNGYMLYTPPYAHIAPQASRVQAGAATLPGRTPDHPPAG